LYSGAFDFLVVIWTRKTEAVYDFVEQNCRRVRVVSRRKLKSEATIIFTDP